MFKYLIVVFLKEDEYEKVVVNCRGCFLRIVGIC